MATYEVKVRHPDGSFEPEPLSLVRGEFARTYNEMDMGRAFVPAPEAEAATLNEDDDEIIVTDPEVGVNTAFAGVLNEAKQDPEVWELVIDGFERYGRTAEPADGLEEYTDADDSTIVRDAIDDVPQLTPGTIDTVKTGLSPTFYFASQALKLRHMRDSSGAYVTYNFDKSVDYTSSIGSVRGTISPAQQNVTEFNIKNAGPEPVANHLRVIGNGTHVDVVSPSYNPATDRKRWARAYYKDMADPETLTAMGESIIAEIESGYREVEAELVRIAFGPNLGDTFTVEYPDMGFSETLDVARVETQIDDGGKRWNVTLSPRDITFDRDEMFESVSGLRRRPVGGLDIPTGTPTHTVFNTDFVLEPSSMQVIVAENGTPVLFDTAQDDLRAWSLADPRSPTLLYTKTDNNLGEVHKVFQHSTDGYLVSGGQSVAIWSTGGDMTSGLTQVARTSIDNDFQGKFTYDPETDLCFSNTVPFGGSQIALGSYTTPTDGSSPSYRDGFAFELDYFRSPGPLTIAQGHVVMGAMQGTGLGMVFTRDPLRYVQNTQLNTRVMQDMAPFPAWHPTLDIVYGFNWWEGEWYLADYT